MLFKDFLKRSTFFVIKNKTYRSNIYFGTESKKNSQRSFDRDPL